MRRTLAISGLMLWAGSTLLLSRLRWFARPSLVDRLASYVPGGAGRPRRGGALSFESFAETIGPLSRAVGGKLSRMLGIGEELSLRLRRIHSPLDVTAFRVRQIGWTLAALGGSTLLALATSPPPPVLLLLLLGAPLLSFLVSEHQVAIASERWQRRLFLELPVVTEQIAMLLSAGYSLTGAINRVATRSSGASATDLVRVSQRLRQGLSERAALDEWATTAQVDAVDRLVAVMALNREATDLGRLLSEEARSIRADVHRELLERIERRGQQVWIPVTVATLLPGVIFMMIPFIEALRQFGTTP